MTDVSMMGDQAQWFHPCYYEEAHKRSARMHLPVAPKCNVQCRFCNRRFDCINETRPGVASTILDPNEAAGLVDRVLERIPSLAVVGIAGPGDALANEATFQTLRIVGAHHPKLALCLATNGLLLPSRVEDLVSLGVRFVTVTVNAIDPVVGERIYSWVRYGGERVKGKDAFRILSSKQWEGMRKCIESEMIVKVNSVLIPGINERELPKIAETSGDIGVDVMNVIPFIPVRGSEFEHERAPRRDEVERMRADCELFVRQITHCARCRSDAIGYLGCDTSSEFY